MRRASARPSSPTVRSLAPPIRAAGGGEAGRERQRKLGRLPVRERLARLLDPGEPVRELGLWAAWKMYPEWGDVPAAGIITGIGTIDGLGGVLAAVEHRYQRSQIQSAAHRYERQIYAGEPPIVGLNRYRDDTEQLPDVEMVRTSRAKKLKQVARLHDLVGHFRPLV